MLRFMILTLFLLGACSKDTKSALEGAAFQVNSDTSSLQERLTLTNEEVPLVDPTGGSLTGILPGIETFVAVQVGELLPPTVGGITLQANDVLIDGLATYIGYNVAGDQNYGGIDLLDITNVLSLQILSGVTSNTSEFYSLARDGATLYATGARSDGATSAFIKQISLTGSLLTNTTTTYDLPSYAGLDVLVTSSSIAAISGDSGGLSLFNKSTMAVDHMVAINDARSVDVKADGSFMVLSGQPGKATAISAAGVTTQTLTLGGATIAGAKSTLQVGTKWSLAALGDGGMTVFCNADGTVIANVHAVPASGVGTTESQTNAAASASGLVFSANGDAGVYVYSLKDVSTTGTCGTGSLTLLGTLYFADRASVNAVYYKNGLLFVVTGSGGLKILSAVYTSTIPLSSNL